MNFLRIIIFIVMSLVLSSCYPTEAKLQNMIDREIGKDQLVERNRLELDKILGKKDSKLKDSALEFMSDRINIVYSETIVDGRRARVTVSAVIPRMEELSSLLMLASSMPKEKIQDMTLEELFNEISKNSRRPATEEGIKNDIYEFSVDFEKKREWVVDQEQIKKAYSKKNLISKK